MLAMVRLCALGLVAVAATMFGAAHADPLKTSDLLYIWPNQVAPGSEHAAFQQTITESGKSPYFPDRSLTGVTKPTLTAFVPDHPNGTSVIVAPGGGLRRIAIDRESYEMARWLNPYSVTVFILAYRLPADGHENNKDVPLQDAQRAVRFVREHAAEWHLDANKIGFLGASAGGYLGAAVGTGFDRTVYAPLDHADTLSARPDFEILLYPVVSMDEAIAFKPSRNFLLGEHPSADVVKAYSPDQNVTKTTPPTFIVDAEDDPLVNPANSLRYFDALKAAGVAAELHVFKEGGHGFGIRDARQLPVSNWPGLAIAWMRGQGLVEGRVPGAE
jgi:acetyl esterase/lipase